MSSRITKMLAAVRPANMRTSHGLSAYSFDAWGECCGHAVISVSASTSAELSDPMEVAASGSGMDAPENLPVGSLKAFFSEDIYGGKTAIGFCQRTTKRASL